jgi:uncharacterized phage protein (predicted DNA packaging)
MSEAPYTKISEITINDLADYLRISELDAPQVQLLTTIKAAAINYIVGVTALTVEQLDNYPDLTLAVYALSQDMYDNRTYYVDKANISDTVSTILNMYRINLL